MAEISYLQVTRDCNLRCIICSNPPNKQELSVDQAKKEIDRFASKGYEGIILTGGEPTLYPELPALIRYCIKKKIPPRIITNGQRTADPDYLKSLRDAGLRHIHLSIYSCRPSVQAALTRNDDALENIKKSLKNFSVPGAFTINVNTVISSYNADHLSETVSWLVHDYPFIQHFVFNGLDPVMGRVMENPEVIPRLNDFELELHQALVILRDHKKTFRIESVPLCYLTDFEYASTETRKIVKNENRETIFLDQRGTFLENDWNYDKHKVCSFCRLNNICAGLYAGGKGFDTRELYPVFIDPQEIINKILTRS